MDLYLDDYHLHSISATLPSTVKRPVAGLENPDQRMDIYDNPGINGQRGANILTGSSMITLTGSVRAIDGTTELSRQENYELARKDLISAFRNKKDADGRPEAFTLRIVMPSGNEYQASVFKHSFKFDLNYMTYGTWTLNLINPRGIVESVSETTTAIYLPETGGLVFPIVFPIVFSGSTAGTATLNNTGNTAATPFIRFYGPMENPVLSNESTGKELGLSVTLVSGDVIEVDPSVPSVVQGTLTTTPSTNKMGSITTGSEFFDIEPGENVLRLRATTYDLGRAEITYRDASDGL